MSDKLNGYYIALQSPDGTENKVMMSVEELYQQFKKRFKAEMRLNTTTPLTWNGYPIIWDEEKKEPIIISAE